MTGLETLKHHFQYAVTNIFFEKCFYSLKIYIVCIHFMENAHHLTYLKVSPYFETNTFFQLFNSDKHVNIYFKEYYKYTEK